MKSRVSVEATELNADENGWTECGIFIDRDSGDEELREQMILLTPEEFEAVFRAMFLQRNDGIWSTRTVES